MDPAAPSLDSATPVEPATPHSKTGPRPFDFRHPVFLSSGQWRRLRIELDEYVASLSALLSTYLRLEFALQISKLQTPTFNEVTGSLPMPTQLILFKTEPLRGISILEVRPEVGLAIVDRLLGGPGQAAGMSRNLSEMETALLDQFAEIVLSEWCKHWNRVHEFKSHIVGHENHPRFLQTSSGSSTMLLVTMDARVGETVGQVQLLFPYTTIEPLLQKLEQEIQSAPTPPPAQPPRVKWNQAFDDLKLKLSARWPATKVTTRTMLRLKPGDFLELQPELAEQIELRAGKVTKFRARLGVDGNKRAVQITEILKQSV